MGNRNSQQVVQNVSEMQSAISTKKKHLVMHFRSCLRKPLELSILTHPSLASSKEAVFQMLQVIDGNISTELNGVRKFSTGATLNPEDNNYILIQSMIPVICDFMSNNDFRLVTMSRASTPQMTHILDIVFQQINADSEVVFE